MLRRSHAEVHIVVGDVRMYIVVYLHMYNVHVHVHNYLRII